MSKVSLCQRVVRGSRRYLTQLQPSERNRKRGLVTVPGSCVEFKIPAEKKGGGGGRHDQSSVFKERNARKLSHAPNWVVLFVTSFNILIIVFNLVEFDKRFHRSIIKRLNEDIKWKKIYIYI